MRIGIVISSNEPEVVWNAFRFGVTALKANHEAKVFLINKGVEAEEIKDEKYDVRKQVELFLENKGELLACGTCLKSRGKDGSKVCPVSSMNDLLKVIEESDKVLTFG